MKRTSAFIAAILILASVFTPLTYGVVLDDYKVTEPYKTSMFYKMASDYVLTGDHRYDIISIALTQLGYNEGSSEADMHGSSNGDRNFVEYNVLYGKVDNGEGNGVSYGYMWCASFVNWVLRTANVDKRITGEFISCGSWVNHLESKNCYKSRESGYTPICGDIIFFKGSRTDARSNHIGFVIGCKDGIVYTIEGNTTGIGVSGDTTNGGEVARKSYRINDTYIVGYGVPRYTVKEGVNYEDFELLGVTPGNPGKYTVMGRSKSLHRSPNSPTALMTIKNGEIVDVTEVNGMYGKCTVDGVTGWINLDSMIYGDGSHHTISYTGCDNEIPPIEKMYGKTVNISSTIPEKAGNKFLGWAVRPGGAIMYQPGDAYKYNLDVTLHAVWEPLNYTITFKNDNGNIISEKTYQYGATVEIPEISKEDAENGKYILSWDQEITPVDGDKTYTAVFTLPEKQPDNTPILLGILIAVVVIAIAAVASALLYTKKNKTKETATV